MVIVLLKVIGIVFVELTAGRGKLTAEPSLLIFFELTGKLFSKNRSKITDECKSTDDGFL